MNARIRQLIVLLAMPVMALASASCGDVSRTGRSPSMLIIDKLEAASGVSPDKLGVPLGSDVQTLVRQTVNGVEVRVPTIFNDVGKVTLRMLLKDIGAPGAEASPSTLNAVTITRYRVVFVRADGRNTPGVDVPYPFDGATTATITTAATDVAFEIVRTNAKEEAPLRALVGNSGRIIIATIAEITFYGRDMAGNEVSVTGSISVNFTDYGDPA